MPGFNPFRYRFPYTNLNDINLDWLIKKVRKLSEDVAAVNPERIEEVAQQAAAAEQTAQDALETAEGVSGIASDAETIARAAQTTANNAADSAQAAGTAAAAAQTTANNAADSAQAAGTAAAAAQTTANAAGSAAAAAQTTANNAADSAQAAGTAAAAAQTAANNAGTAAAAAQTAIAIVQNTNIATRNIAQYQYVIWKGSLYIASSAIASGATLSSSNLTAVDDGGLNELAYCTPGKRYTFGFFGCGFVSDSGKSITFNCTSGKRVLGNPTIESLKLIARGVSGYVDMFNYSLPEVIGNTDFSISVTSGTNFLEVKLLKTTALANAANNTPVTVNGAITFIA